MLLPAVSIAFLVTVIFLLALRPFAISTGLVDHPGGRKQHIGAVPIIGGIAMFSGLFAGTELLGLDTFGTALLVSGGLLVTIGVLDDRYPLPPFVRLGAQLSAVLILYFAADVRVASLGDIFGFGAVDLGPGTLLMTLLIAMSVVNAYNLVDGVDGLAGTMGVLALGPVAIIAGYTSIPGTIACLAMATVLGFLCFNFPTVRNRRVRTFMGDAGSTLVGLIIFVAIASASQGDGAVFSPVVGLWFAALPIFDLFTCFVRRIRKGHSPFKPGRDHFHHVLTRGGFGVRKTLGILTLMQTAYLSLGLIGHYAGIPEPILFASWSAVGLTQWWFIRKFAAISRNSRVRARIRSEIADEATRKAA